MGLVFHLICLFFTLFVLQSYVSSGFHAREHRLLPLVLGLIALNSFYRITYYVTGEAQTLRILTDLLAIHMLYLMIHYVGDFMKFQLKLRTEVILFCSLVLFNSMLIIRAAQRETYQDAFRIALLCYTGILLGLATYVRVKSEVSVWEGHVNDMLYLGMALPGVAMLFRAVTPKAEEFLVPGAFEISCLIVFYLMMTGRLSNVTNIIRENFYNISDIPTFLFDNRMRYRDANASARRWFPEIVGELTDDPQEYPFYTKMMRWSKDPDQDYVVQWKESYCRCQLHPVCSENVVRGYILTLLDITQQKKETVLMEDLKKKAEEQSFLKSRFLASVSHDLRSPLHAIIGGSDILKRQNLPDESKNILEYIRVAGNNLLEQVDTILAYSKLEAGMLTLKDKTYNFYEMIEEQARLCLLNIREKDIVFTVRFLDRFPEQVSGDYLRVAQIFQNILSNACKFTEQGTITLSLHCKMEEGQVWFDGCVEDTGVGMTKEKLAQVFAEYVSFSEDMGVEGFGLGLSIVRQLVEMTLDAHLKGVLEQNLVSLFDAYDGTILYVSHDIDEALRFCDRIAVVEAGRIMETGTGDDLVNRPQSLAGVKLSGCKNATAAVRAGERSVRLPKWGIEAATSAAVPEDVKALGVRAFFLQRVDGPGENCYRVRVDRVSDSRFERTVLLGFLDRDESEAPTVSRTDDEMKYLHQHLFWRVDKLAVPVDELPHEGEELWIRIPPDKVYLVSR